MPRAASSMPRPANAATSSMKKRRGETARSTMVRIGRNSAAGCSGFKSRRACRTLVARAAGGKLVRTTSCAPSGPCCVAG